MLVGWLWRSSSIPQPGILSPAQRTMRKRRTVPRKSLSRCPAHNWSSVPGRHQTSFQLVAQSTFRSSELQNAFLSPRPCVPSYWKSFLEIGKFRLDNLRVLWYFFLPSRMPSVPHAINYKQMFFINKQRTSPQISEFFMPMFKSGIVIKLHEQWACS